MFLGIEACAIAAATLRMLDGLHVWFRGCSEFGRTVEEIVELTGVDGIALAAHGLDILQQFRRAPLETLDLAGELSLSFAMGSSIQDGCHPTFKLKRRCHHPVNISFNGFAGQSIFLSWSRKSCDGLPGELLRSLGFLDPEFQLGEGFRRKLCLGLMVDRTATNSAETKHDH